ncbi:receptor-like cytosolic serine/threonine-protein kinase RBK1 isoform X1 [Panicum miliaceum]|uniref:non-specific serine/threonine protein kinase n=1 Tax=Panicum miliaceum TaxID=4540 RepID=A0A3L6PI94_PANMI|nr:receptor-like cytosolic serine/threonine-protein kinase RBK1 isoform X1 [Panicum miliaceum]
MVKLMEFFLRGPAEAGEDERLLKDLPGSSDKEGEDQENIKSNLDETAKEDCDNGGSVIEATVSSEDLNDRHGGDSNSQCAESNGACKPMPEMSSKSVNGECAGEVPEMGSKSSNDDNSGSTDEMPRIGTKSNSDDNSDCADRSSPRAVLDMSVSGSVDSDDSASVEQSAESNHNVQWRNLISGLILRRKKSMGRAVTFPQRSKSRGLRGYLERMRSGKNQMDCSAIAPEVLPEIGKRRPSWRSFDYEELCAATDRFSPEKLIGKGGHAEVYKGQLADGQFVAVKRLTKGGNKEDRVSDFLSELGIIAHVNHPNAAQLLGFSVEGGLHLVLQFSPHGSLASVLHGTKETLKWKVRFNIALGIAEGLLYLHEGCHRRIIHRDIKASNILLTEDYQPQISDFGLAKWLPDKLTHHVVYPIEGTFGYMAPEYFMHGIINEKTDVFAYGVLLLELVTGRKAVDSSRQSLVIWAKPLLDANNIKELVDPSLGNEYDPEEMVYTLAVASLCMHHSSTTRPSMKSVVCFLKGDRKSLELVRRPKIVKPLMFDSCDSEDYTRSSYLNDLNRHKQLALEQ